MFRYITVKGKIQRSLWTYSQIQNLSSAKANLTSSNRSRSKSERRLDLLQAFAFSIDMVGGGGGVHMQQNHISIYYSIVSHAHSPV